MIIHYLLIYLTYYYSTPGLPDLEPVDICEREYVHRDVDNMNNIEHQKSRSLYKKDHLLF